MRRISLERAVREIRRAYADVWRIDMMHHRGWLTDQHWEVGRRFRVLWVGACGQPHVTGAYDDRIGGSSTADATAHVEHCRREMGEAIRELGQVRSAVVISVCGMDEEVARRGKVLREGLDVLASWWGIPADHKRRAISF